MEQHWIAQPREYLTDFNQYERTEEAQTDLMCLLISSRTVISSHLHRNVHFYFFYALNIIIFFSSAL